MLKYFLSKPVYQIIVIPVIIAVIIIFFEPSISSVREGLFSFVGSLSNSWRDHIYYDSNKNPESKLDLVILEMIMLIFVIGYSSFWISISIGSYGVAKLINGEEGKKKEPFANQDNKNTVVAKIKISTLKLIITNSIASSITVLVFLLVYTSFATSIILETNFKNRFGSVEVGISEAEHKMIVSKWATMKDKKSYDSLMNDIKNLSEKYKIEVPEIL